MPNSSITNAARFSPDQQYRYALWRVWDVRLLPLTFVLMNPSTADATKNDPTVRRCIRFAKDAGYGGVTILNIFAYRATDPRVLARHMHSGGDIVGPENDDIISIIAGRDEPVVAAWGRELGTCFKC